MVPESIWILERSMVLFPFENGQGAVVVFFLELQIKFRLDEYMNVLTIVIEFYICC